MMHRPPMSDRETELTLADFERYFPYTPAALCIKECARLSALRRLECRGPVLDVGCGDGLFASIALDGLEAWGIDVDANEGRRAAESRAYSRVLLTDVTHVQLPERFFATCLANCSLEHVPHLDQALANIHRSLQPGGRILMFVPNRNWITHFLSYRALTAIGAASAAAWLRDTLNSLFKHHHLYDADGWRHVVQNAGFDIEAVDPVLSSASTVAFELFLLPSLLGWANKRLTTRWTNFPAARRLFARPAYALAKAILDASDSTPTAEILVIGRRPTT